jgi:zinc transport system substrate-binding protein
MILNLLRIILMKLRTLGPLLTLLLTAPAVAGCGALGESSDDKDGSLIAAAFYPLEYLAERVAGDHYDVVNLTQPGVEPHDLALDVGQTATVTRAALVLFEHGFQPAVDATVEQNAGGEVVDAAEIVELHELGEEGHDEDDGHDHGDLDPHFWQDPLLMADLGDAVAAKVSKLDPEHADEYAANAAALRTDLETLDAEYAEALASCERDLVVVNHDAFGYLAKYGLHLEPIVGVSPDAEPTADGLARLHQLVKDEGITTVFSETLVSKKTAETLASDLGIEVAVLDPLEGLSGDGDYLSVMRANLTSLTRANECR